MVRRMGRLLGVVALMGLLAGAWWLVRDGERRVAALDLRPGPAASGPATPSHAGKGLRR